MSLPEWADPQLIQTGEDLFWRYGTKLILVLYCYSLPFCYLGRNGVQVLALTTRLASNPTRRIVETAQLLVDVMQAGGLTTPTGRGRRSIQKVRLMHAAIRQLAPTAPQWKASFGLPVNQEDLAGTLMSFSWIALDGLDKLGVEVTPAEREAFLHCWLVIGHLLGIQPELLPRDVASAKGTGRRYCRSPVRPVSRGSGADQGAGRHDGLDPARRRLQPRGAAVDALLSWARPGRAGWELKNLPGKQRSAAPLRVLGIEAQRDPGTFDGTQRPRRARRAT